MEEDEYEEDDAPFVANELRTGCGNQGGRAHECDYSLCHPRNLPRQKCRFLLLTARGERKLLERRISTLVAVPVRTPLRVETK